MRRRDMIAISVFIVFYVGFGVLLTVFQERFVYRPFPQDFGACLALTEAEKVTYNGTRMYVQEGTKGIVVLYHGNAGSACDRAFYTDIFEAEGYGYVLVEYAGYSNDARRPTHELVKRDVENTVGYVALQDAERVTYEGTRMYVKDGEKGMVVLYHGNAGSACDRFFYADLFTQEGYGYVLVEYAGYSNDARRPTHERVKQDVRNVVAYLETVDSEKLVVLGESIGTGAAAYHTSLVPPDAVILISPFASLKDVAQRKFWFYPAFLLADNAFDNVELLRAYRGPVSIIHGDRDRIISQQSGKKLYEQLMTDQKTFISVEGGGHNNLWDSPQLPRSIVSAIEG
jgi:pimeloyl-ACP methyl ester carboxylesterase